MSNQQVHINDAIEKGGIRVTASVTDEQADALTAGALRFVAAPLNDGRTVSRELVERMIAAELQGLRENMGDERYESGRFGTAAEIFARLTTGDGFPAFMSLVGYEYLD